MLINKNILFIGLAGLAIVIALYFLAQKEKEPEPEYSLRNYNTKEDSEHVKILTAIPDEELVKFRCTMPFINNGQDKYFWRIPYQDDLFDEISEKVFLKAINTIKKGLPKNRTLISGRFCETEEHKVILDYYIADRKSVYYEGGNYDGYNVEGYIAILSKNGKPEKSILFVQDDFWPQTGCKPMFQMTRTNVLYMTCAPFKGLVTDVILYSIDIPKEKVTPLHLCRFNRTSEFKKTCSYIHEEG